MVSNITGSALSTVLSTMKATTISLQSGSGAPTTQASATPGWVSSTSSTSRG
jgi:hypothetical protein